METTPLRAKILDTIVRKSTLKQKVFDNTFAAFNLLKETLLEIAAEMDDELDGKLDRRVRLEYRDRGKFEAQLQVANDLLIFQMHTDVFEFDANHLIWQNPYVQADQENSYCGLINIYNFLSDSFKFNRNADEGYLIGRIFINRERRYFVEGKQQTSMRAMSFGKAEIDRDALVDVLEAAIAFSLNFDLLMPPYEENKRVTVDQFNTKMDNSKFVTGKRLGYFFAHFIAVLAHGRSDSGQDVGRVRTEIVVHQLYRFLPDLSDGSAPSRMAQSDHFPDRI